VPADGRPLGLRLEPTRPHLVIHVTRADGSPPGEEFDVLHAGYMGSDLPEWPEQPRLLVGLAPGSVSPADRFGPYLRARQTGPGEFVVQPADDVSVDVAVVGGHQPWRPRRVRVPEGAGRVDVDLAMQDPVRLGVLRLDVVDEDGAALLEQVGVPITGATGGMVFFDRPFNYAHEGDWPLVLPLPDGSYLLSVDGRAWFNDIEGQVIRRRELGGWEQPLIISADSETRVTARVGAGARLSVHLAGAATEADRRTIRERYGADRGEELVESWASFVDLRLCREGRWPEAVDFLRPWGEGTSAAGLHAFHGLWMGQEGVSEPLTPGRYTLVASTSGGREVRRDVQLLAGTTLTVSLSFD